VTVTLGTIILRAANDLAFRDALLADPDRALAAERIAVDERVRAALAAYVRIARR
jgi:hypothetical protein